MPLAVDEENLEPGWSIPVPRGIDVKEPDVLPLADRVGPEIELIEELVIGEASGGPEALFTHPTDVAATADGRIVVVDGWAHEAKIFDADGNYLRTLGREGSGPGEFQRAQAVAIVGDRICIVDATTRRLSVWDLDGDLVSDEVLDARQEIQWAHPGPDFLVGWYTPYRERPQHIAIARFSLDGEETLRYGFLPETPTPRIQRTQGASSVSTFIPIGVGSPWFAVSASGDVYLTVGDEYEVLALAADGQPRWALRAPWPRRDVTNDDIDQAIAKYATNFTPQEIASVRWPERLAALSAGRRVGEGGHSLYVDGHGHLYVFPYIPWGREERTVRPVDVYSTDGDLLFSGMMTDRAWISARGDFVYGIELDEASEYQIVRYRLVEPF